MVNIEQVKALMRMGAGLDDALRYVGGRVGDVERQELAEYEFRLKLDEAAELERKLRDVIEVQVEKGSSRALLWALEKKLARYNGGGAADGVITITIGQSERSDIVEEG
jgi:hypothetical protein